MRLDPSSIAPLFEDLQRVPTHTFDLCRGLDYSETSCLAALMLGPQPRQTALRLHGEEGRRVQQALERLSHAPSISLRPLGQAILTRLHHARCSSIALLHPDWVARIQRTERAKVASLVLTSDPLEPTPIQAWLQETVAHQSGLFDTRHLYEWRQGHVLEPDLLRLAPTQDIINLILRLGLAVTGSIFRAADRTYLSAMVRKLGVNFGRRMVEALQSGPRLPEGSSRLVVTRFGSRRALDRSDSQLLPRIERTGLFVLSCALAFRGRVYFEGVAHALPLRLGETMLVNRANIVSDRLAQQIHTSLLRWVLESLSHLAELGQTQEPYHTRTLVLHPPEHPITASLP
ncbi:MAG: hypothetical protein AAFS10_21640 [Myxococcota bacterium]